MYCKVFYNILIKLLYRCQKGSVAASVAQVLRAGFDPARCVAVHGVPPLRVLVAVLAGQLVTRGIALVARHVFANFGFCMATEQQ